MASVMSWPRNSADECREILMPPINEVSALTNACRWVQEET
jgi:hypothetical protein